MSPAPGTGLHQIPEPGKKKKNIMYDMAVATYILFELHKYNKVQT